MGLTYFFDTYAFHELIKGGENYKAYTAASILTTRLNLMELYYTMLLKYGQQEAERCYSLFLDFVVDIDDDIIKEAMMFKKESKKRSLSYIDCIGYILAKRRGVKFLTGDKEFEHLENVEFVK